MFPSASGPGWRASPQRWPRKRPPSPRVAVTRATSTPSEAYFASVPPTPSDSSSGWASTAISLRRELIAGSRSFRDHCLHVLAWHDESVAATQVLRPEQRNQVGLEGGPIA